MLTPHSRLCQTTRSSSPLTTESGTSSGIASCLATWELAATCGPPWASTRATEATGSVRFCSTAGLGLGYGSGLTKSKRSPWCSGQPQDLRLRLDLCEAGAGIGPAGHSPQRTALSAPLPLLTRAQRADRHRRDLRTGGPVQRRRAAGPGRSRREPRRRRRRGIRVPAWRSTQCLRRQVQRPRRGASLGTRRLPTSGRPACCGVSLALLSIPMTVRLGWAACGALAVHLSTETPFVSDVGFS
jgi:hypothetical protein